MQAAAPTGRSTTPSERKLHEHHHRRCCCRRQHGKVAAADVVKLDGKTATTLNGASLKVSTQGGVRLNGDVQVTKTDIAASNGLIHVIDTVLLPSA
ncbi:MAG: fasciclin domain-containing protein [Aquabacterium sp.]|nr:fasciclin domain-containing protein [Aquabacterium sp.]